MGKLVIESLDKKIKLKKLANAVYKTLNQTDFLKAELVYMNADDMKKLNSDTRNVDKVTDVLSFPTLENQKNTIIKAEENLTELEGKYVFLGSIVLCEQRIKEQAEELGHSEERETIYLIIHGLMHLFGYDHMEEKDKAEMREKEKSALKLLEIED